MLVYLVFCKEPLATEFDDAAPCNQADEGVLIVHNGDKILVGRTLHQILHRGGNPDRQMVSAAADLHNAVSLRLAHIHIAHILDGPQKIAFC